MNSTVRPLWQARKVRASKQVHWVKTAYMTVEIRAALKAEFRKSEQQLVQSECNVVPIPLLSAYALNLTEKGKIKVSRAKCYDIRIGTDGPYIFS